MGQGITVGYLEQAEKQKSRELWEEAFPEDSRSFDDYYFSEKLKDNRILALKEAGQIQAMIHLNPYLIQTGSCRWQADYLVGVATRKECRHRGYMRRLLMQMMTDMRRAEMPFCFLMPADEAIYRPFGFTYIFDQPKWKWKREVETEGRLTRRSLVSQKDLNGIAAWMNQWLSDRWQVYGVRSEDYLKRLILELSSEQGTLDAVYDGESLVGVESVWGFEKREQRLLYGKDSYIEESGAAKPAIMARIISPEKFVQAVRLRESVKEEKLVLSLRLSDPLIPENDGLWNWYLDHETSWMERKNEIEDAPALTIQEFTGWLFGYEVPESAEPYRDVVQTLSGVFLDEVV